MNIRQVEEPERSSFCEPKINRCIDCGEVIENLSTKCSWCAMFDRRKNVPHTKEEQDKYCGDCPYRDPNLHRMLRKITGGKWHFKVCYKTCWKDAPKKLGRPKVNEALVEHL